MKNNRFNRMNVDMTQGKPSKIMTEFMVPLIMGSILQNLYNVADTIVVGRYLGKDALAAVGNSYIPMLLVNGIVMGIASGISILISQYFGGKNTDKIKKAYTAVIELAVVLSALLTIGSLMSAGAIFKMMNMPSEMLEQGTLYFSVIALGFPCVVVYNFLAAISRAIGNSRIPFYFLVLSCFLNILFDIYSVIILGMGIRGIAISTVLAQLFSGAGIAIYFLRNGLFTLKDFQINFKIDVQVIALIVKYGLTSIFQNFFSGVSMLIIQSIINTFSVDVISAYAAAYKIESIMTIPVVNLGTTLGVFVAQNAGAGESKRLRDGLKTSFKIAMFITAGVNAVVFFGGKSLMRVIVKNDEAVVLLGFKYLQIVGLFYICLAALYILTNFLRSSGEVKYPIFNTFLELAARIIFALILTEAFGIMGIFSSRPLSFLISTLSLTIRYKMGIWEHMAVKERK
ncbi:putative MATE family efflux protein [Anaerobacterium chartisolvens]|uniref:Probable multidrug resistance protein NorM n=1 Tax=Anaerobacterium chartisolvens TaxID=1297424 RepID=A0A369BDG3_9FIRM|nr:MATE family efflux transporter [Anaerobacterium chartisolvens]RCX19441.1 putative MATE family efflux protein [Anaerobacterium chartisolvens]